MSTDLHDRTRQPDPGEGPDKPRPPKSSLSIAQVVGGALAAMTAAALGSRLSLAGTVLGAAIASIVAAVAGAIYTASLRRTTQGVSTVLARVRPTTPGVASATSPTTPSASASASASSATTAADGGGTATGWDLPTGPTGATPDASTPVRRARVGWKQVLVAALLMFVVAALVLTGIELATGRALSGGNGTTVGQVAEPSTRPAAEPTKRATATPSATPSATASARPSETAAPSATPSSGPTAEPTPAASPTPSTTLTPSASATPTVAPSAPAAPAVTPAS